MALLQKILAKRVLSLYTSSIFFWQRSSFAKEPSKQYCPCTSIFSFCQAALLQKCCKEKKTAAWQAALLQKSCISLKEHKIQLFCKKSCLASSSFAKELYFSLPSSSFAKELNFVLPCRALFLLQKSRIEKLFSFSLATEQSFGLFYIAMQNTAFSKKISIF